MSERIVKKRAATQLDGCRSFGCAYLFINDLIVTSHRFLLLNQSTKIARFYWGTSLFLSPSIPIRMNTTAAAAK